MFDTAALLAAIPGCVHGFTDREGGVSTGGYATLNMASKWGDDGAAVEENRRRVAAAAGFELGRLRCVRQVHGTDVLNAASLAEDSTADALWCRRDDGLVVGVLTADCVPILVVDDAGTVAAAIHSGWRGTAANIVGGTVAALAAQGVEPRRLRAAIGPCIERAAFEVGPEVADAFDPRFVVTGGARPHVDLLAAVTAQLKAAGIEPRSIERVGGCTHANPSRWFSYRRDGAGVGRIGQMLAFVGFTP